MAPVTAQKRLIIEASPEVVWKVHTDVNAWSQWHRSISSARAVARLAVGSSFEWKSGGLTIASTVQTLEQNRRILAMQRKQLLGIAKRAEMLSAAC